MKTLDDCKEQISKEKMYDNWGELFSINCKNPNYLLSVLSQAAELYAEQKAKEESILFANFIGNRPLPEYSESINQWRWWNNETREYNYATTEQLYEQFKSNL